MRKERRFTLQPILDHRIRLEKRALCALAECRDVRDAHRRAVEWCEKTVTEFVGLLHGTGAVRVAAARACEFNVAKLHAAADAHVAGAASMEPALARAYRAARQARRDRRAIEILRERHVAELVAEECRAEEEEIAEMATLRRQELMAQ